MTVFLLSGSALFANVLFVRDGRHLWVRKTCLRLWREIIFWSPVLFSLRRKSCLFFFFFFTKFGIEYKVLSDDMQNTITATRTFLKELCPFVICFRSGILGPSKTFSNRGTIVILLCLQSGPQVQKSVIFSHSVINLNQLLQNSKNTANIFLTFRNHAKIFLSQNIMQIF